MKRIVICSDGTWNVPDQTDRGERRPSNVVHINRAIAQASSDGTSQIVFYDPGVGTAWGLDRLVGGAFGTGLSRNVEDGYRFLVDNHAPSDEIYLFGFSRGAYTVRSIVGLIRKCGLLHKTSVARFPEAYALYRDGKVAPDAPKALRFRRDHAREVTVRFLGVWDTVGSLGVPGMLGFLSRHHQFHDVTLTRIVERACHAVAIDEHRKWFMPSLWNAQNVPGQIVEQVWFAGAHTNVGGGYEDTGLSDIAFLWMKGKAEEAGLAFDADYVRANIHPDPLGAIRDSRKGLYRLIPVQLRPIGEQPAGHEAIHASVYERGRKDSDYRPPNLMTFLARTGGTLEEEGRVAVARGHDGGREA
ncbi:MAG: DUF2235 domain-containing protein [Candidatus Polarisedimenticolia bacterium]